MKKDGVFNIYSIIHFRYAKLYLEVGNKPRWGKVFWKFLKDLYADETVKCGGIFAAVVSISPNQLAMELVLNLHPPPLIKK